MVRSPVVHADPTRLRRILDWLGIGRGGPVLLLVLLLSVDVLLVGTTLLQGFTGEPSQYTFDVGAERSYGEFMEYVQTLWVVSMLVLVWWRLRPAVLAVWAVVFAWYGVDNAFMLHERAGLWIATNTELVGRAGSYAIPVGEVLYMAVVGVLALGALVATHRRSRGLARRLSARLFVLSVALVFFGLLVDAVHAPWSGTGGPADVLLTVLEDGGEMVVVSVTTAVMFAVATTILPDRPATTWVDDGMNRPETASRQAPAPAAMAGEPEAVR